MGARRSTQALAVGLLALVWAVSSAFAAESPRLEVRRPEGRPAQWVLAGLPPILAGSEVKEHLTTGLTTTFVLKLTSRDAAGKKIVGAGRVQVRYELWDEVFYVATLGIDGAVGRRPEPLH